MALVLQHPHKNVDIDTCASTHDIGKWDRQIPLAFLWDSQRSQKSKLQGQWETASTNYKRRDWEKHPLYSSGSHICRHGCKNPNTHMCAHINHTHTHINKYLSKITFIWLTSETVYAVLFCFIVFSFWNNWSIRNKGLTWQKNTDIFLMFRNPLL